MAGAIHKFVRMITRAYPYRTPAHSFNRLVGLFANGDKPVWLRAEQYRGAPLMELNVADRFQRKVYFFPVAYARRAFDDALAAYLRQRLRPGDAFLDIGANIGYYSLLAAQLVGARGTVVSFEPEPGAFESLSRSVAANGLSQVSSRNLALSNRQGALTLYRARDTAHSLIATTEMDPEFRGKVDVVDVTTLDVVSVLTPDFPVDAVRAIKIDVEGEEARVAEGMLGYLQRARLPPIWAEVRGPGGSARAPDTFAAMARLLRPLGYRAFRWRTDSVTEVSEGDVREQEDILFATEP